MTHKEKTTTVVVFISILLLSGCLSEVEKRIQKGEVEQAKENLVEKNSMIYLALVEAGFEDTLVDVTNERILIRIKLGPKTNEHVAVFAALTAAATVSPETPLIVVQLVEGKKINKEIRVETSKVIKMIEGESDPQKLVGEMSITKK